MTSRNLTVQQGDSINIVFRIKNDDGSVFDLTGYTARLQVRRTYGATSTLISCTLANGKLVLQNAVGGLLALELQPSDTSVIRFDQKDDDTLDCVYDCEITSPAGSTDTIASGAFTILREVTR